MRIVLKKFHTKFLDCFLHFIILRKYVTNVAHTRSYEPFHEVECDVLLLDKRPHILLNHHIRCVFVRMFFLSIGRWTHTEN